MAEADKKRNEAYILLKYYLKNYCLTTLLPHYKSAVALYEVFKQFGLDLATYNYAEQTAQLTKLIEALSIEEYPPLTNLALLPTFEDLKQKQKVFESLYFEQAEANATLRQTQSATSIRKNVEKVLRDYLAYLTIFKDNPEYKTLYGDIQQIIKGVK